MRVKTRARSRVRQRRRIGGEGAMDVGGIMVLVVGIETGALVDGVSARAES